MAPEDELEVRELYEARIGALEEGLAAHDEQLDLLSLSIEELKKELDEED